MKSICGLKLILATTLLLTGCSSVSKTPIPTQTLLTNNASPTKNATPQTQTLVTPSSIVSPTVAFFPTLPPAEAETKVIELLCNNGGCRLPCFWSFPLSQNAAEFSSFLTKTGNEDGTIVVMRDDLFLEVQTALAGVSKSIYTHAYRKFSYGVEKIYGSSYYNEYFQYYSLHNLLAIYGPPEQVYIVLDTGIADMGLGIDLYLLSIEYPKDGWMAVFEMPLQRKENIFLGCPSEAFVNLSIWLPGNNPVGTFLGGFGGDDKSYLFTIEEATSMTPDRFYLKFKDPSNTACLETPANIHK